MKFPSIGVTGVVALGLLSTSAFAYSTGNVTFSGKQSASQTCNTCHMGGTAPTVTLTGPSSLEAGTTGQYSLTIQGGAGVKGGMNVAVDGGAKLTPGAGERLDTATAEITHTAPKVFSSGQVTFDFSMVAPASAGTVKIYAAGNSVNGDANSTGDQCSTTTLSVTITGGTTTTPPTTTPTDPATPSENEKSGGCSASGDSPMLLSVLAAAAMLRLRRRRA